MDVSDSNISVYLLIAMTAMAISMVVIPLMMRLAPAVGMIDTPDARKVHTMPIPRVGGLGIVLGALVPMLVWLPFTDLTISIILGTTILLVFGTWDDIVELGHYMKFIGQFLAAVCVVYYGDLYVSTFPLNNYEAIPEFLGKPFTVVAIVGMINAINHSDGLDGLAGGESLISLGVIAYLAFVFDSALMLIICAATVGGIFGFLRFNSHPARVFMGDGGSQFLGFILAILVIVLTQQVNTSLSPAVPVLLLGLPIIDILAVFFLRAKHKMNLFKATRNHIHHRLLDIGFLHYESVMFIYTAQFILVISAIPLMYYKDLSILVYYLVICSSIFAFLTLFERFSLKIHKEKDVKKDIFRRILNKHPHLRSVPQKLIESGLSLFIIASALLVTHIPTDFAISSLVLLVLMLLVLIFDLFEYQLYRLILFVTIGFSVYLLSTYPPDWLLEQISLVYIFFMVVTVASFITIRITIANQFQVTPLDYLLVIMMIIVSMAPDIKLGASSTGWMAAQIIILFYACELVIQSMSSRINGFTGATGVVLVLIAFRGLA